MRTVGLAGPCPSLTQAPAPYSCSFTLKENAVGQRGAERDLQMKALQLMTWCGRNDRAGSQQPSTSCRLHCAADGGGRFVRHNIVRALARNQESEEGFEAM